MRWLCTGSCFCQPMILSLHLCVRSSSILSLLMCLCFSHLLRFFSLWSSQNVVASLFSKQFSLSVLLSFQTFLYLFAIRKVGQWKTLSGQRKTLSSQRKIWFGFQESVFPFGCVLFSGKWFPGNHFPNFPVFVCHQKSWSTKNTFQSKENLAWFSGKCFPEKFGRKTLSGSCEKFINVIIC